MNANNRSSAPVGRPFSNMVGRLRHLALSRPEDTALIVVSRDGEVRLDYAALDKHVRALAAQLQGRFAKGERALLLLDNDEHYVVAFLACLYAGLTAVPVFPPESIREQHLARLSAIAADCEAACVLTSSSILSMVGTQASLFGQALAMAVDTLEEALADGWAPHDPKDGDIAFLQYTSGSTATPKGVMVSHGNLMANERAIEAGMSVVDDDVFVTWLPLYHDMGLIGGLLQPLHRGVPVVLMSPTYFLERPIRWLEAIARHGGTVSGGPDFAFRLCLERIKSEQAAGLDLSSWRLAFSGAEPVRHDTLASFIDHFSVAGFAAKAVYPCYGLAEATLFVTGGRRGSGLIAQSFADDSLAQGRPRLDLQGEGAMLVSCGHAAADHVVAMVDVATRTHVGEGQVGEIWVSGPSVAQGYWRRQAESEETFVEEAGRRWLRTGDLGFVHEGQHYIAGHIKDVIILRGQNIYPQDIERAIEAEVEAVRKGRVAAFAVSTADGGEGVGVAVEVSRGLQKLVPAEALVEALSLAVSAACREAVAVALLLNPGALPKTSSGKLQRGACRQGWREGSLDAYAVFEHGRFVRGGRAAKSEEAVVSVEDEVESGLAALWAQVLHRQGGTQAAIGREAHFFASGGNSLAAVQLAARMGERWAIDCPVRMVFEHPRLSAMATEVRRLRSRGTHRAKLVVPVLSAERRAAPLPLSHAQQRQWFLWQLDPKGTAYHVSGAVRLSGALDVPALRAGVAGLVARHESLRTVFVDQGDGQAAQWILPSLALDVPLHDLRGMEADGREARASQLAQSVNDVPFDLTRGPLLRAALIQVKDDEHILVLVMHHIVSDGASMQVFIDELATRYLAHLKGQAPVLPTLPIQYADHAVWQRDWLAAGEGERQLAYWRAQLGDDQPVLALPTDHPRQAGGSNRAGLHVFELPQALVGELRQVAQGSGVTLFMLLLAGFQALLHRYTGQEDVRVGVPVANRHRIDTEGVIGFFVNTLVLRNQVRGRTSLAQVLAQTREAALGAQAHQDLPFEQLVDALQGERSLSHSPLFQVMFNHLIEDHRALQALPGIVLDDYPMDVGASQFELTLEVRERPDGVVTGRLVYAAELFEASTMARLAGHYVQVLRALAHQSSLPVGDVALMSDDELALVDSWSRNEGAVQPVAPQRAVVHHLFEQQVANSPNAMALVFGEAKLSYAELNRRANQLAHHLIGLGVRPETRVGIAAERSIDMVVGLLGIMKAGGAYVPLDPDHPVDRLAYVVEDSGIRLLLSQQHLNDRLPKVDGLTVLALDGLDLGSEPSHNPDVPLHGENLVYVIYTSGSTGRPKGAGNRHRSLLNRLAWGQQHQPIGAGDTVLQKTPFSFDISFWEFFWPLTVGARLALAGPGDHRDPGRLVELILQHGVSTIHFVPSMLRAFMGHDGIEACVGLKRIICSGEALPADLQNQVLAVWPGVELLNLYGPTEAAIEVTYWDCRNDGALTVPIGRPIGDVSIHVLDADLQVVPRGVAGELVLGGAGLARGYWNRPALTAERFVADPVGGDGGRLYRTGDLVRWRLDGQIEYLGRIDHQVKIRGFRIELGEVEAQMLAQAGVKEAVVVAQTVASGARLVAYVAADLGVTLDLARLKEELARELPDYMVPGAIVVLPSLPLNANGKVDRKALPEPELASEAAYEAPQGVVEEALASVWQAVLGTARVGRHDNFFELGGDSILSLQIVARARQVGWKLTPRQLFERQTVAALAGVAQAATAKAHTSDVATGQVPLLPIQAAFFAREVPARHHWNQAVMLASPQVLDAAMLARALDALVRHHDGLRLRFTPDAEQRGAWTQTYDEHTPQDLLWVRQATDAGQIEALCADAQRSLDLAAGPLLRAMLVELADGSARLLLVAHHLVIDGVSWRILLEDLQTACAQLAANQPVVLPDKTSSYQAWSRRLQRDVPLHDAQLAHWQSLAGLPVELPCDVPQGVSTGGDTVAGESHLSLTLDHAATQALLKVAPAAYRTQVNDILLTALGRALCAWSGQDRLLIDLEGHGREDTEGDLDLSRTVGWFTSLYPVALDAQGTPTQALQRVKEQLRQVPHKGLGHGVLKHLGDARQRAALAALPQPQVVFNYLGQFDTSFGAGSPWQLAQEESTGPWQDAGAPRWHALAINGQVLGGELSLRFSYSETLHRRDTIAALVTRCEAELRGLIALCMAPDVAGATPSDFPLARIDQSALDALPVPINEVEDLYPLSPMQQGMLFHSVLDPDGSAYLTQLRVDLAGLDVTAFQAAWRAAFQRHAILRTGFLAHMDPPLQWVARDVDLSIQLLDWRGQDGNLAEALDALAQADLARGFDLARPPLTRLALIRTSEDTHHFIWTSHHLLLDGWSTARLMAEVLRPQAPGTSPIMASSYRDYIAWLQGVDQQAAREYWSGQLANMAGPTRLAEVWPRPQAKPLGKAPMQEQALLVNAACTEALLALARRERVTLNTIVQAAWALLLQRCTGQQTVCFGATTAGRPGDLPGVEQLLGLFINTVPVVATPQAAMALGDWLRELQAANLAGREHEHTPLSEIQRWSGQGGQALFDSILVFENYPIDEALKGDEPGAARLSALRFRDDTHYPLTVSVMLEQAGEIKLLFSCDPQSFDQATVGGIAARLGMLLQRLPIDASAPLGQVDALLDSERTQLRQWHANTERQRSTDPVHMLIEDQALIRPQAPALIHDDVVLSHAELNRRANRLAHQLIALGVRPESRVGLSLERGVDMIVALLAILKAGGAYVPLDPDYPVDRLAYMVKDSGLSLVLTQASLLSGLPTHEGVRVVCVDQMSDEAGPDHDPAVRVHGHNLAYVIYTSGSTGKPKGVCVAHHALAEHAQVGIGFFGLTQSDRMLQFSTLNFDGFIEQVFPTLCAGAAIVLRGPQLWDSETFHRELIDKRISVVDLTTVYWFLLVQDFARQGLSDYGVLRQVHAGGEAMPPEGLKAWHDAGMSHIRLLNTYGPTEATVTATVQDCAELLRPWPNPLPIGRPLAGRQLYVLDADLHLVPPGVAGELCVGGELLARGYGQRPGLTAERFIANAFDDGGGRLYRTGDLVRWDAEGRLQYLGRLDHQVKIRGFRIELGEVEAELLRQDGVRQALVLAEPAASGLRLIAYVAGGLGAPLQAGALRAQLARTLPDYMVPGVVMVLDALPLNPNGKIDRHALPRPDAALAAHFEAPQGEVEQALAAIWAQVLGAERVGRHDSFFELGGHSLAAIQITALLAQRHGCELAVRSLFEHSSLSALAALLPAERFGQSRAHRLSEMDRLLTEFEE